MPAVVPPESGAQAALRLQERQFANDVGAATGFDPRVIYAQEGAEGAYAPNGTGGLNFLNLKAATVSSLGDPFASTTSGGFAQFANLQQAERASIDEYKSPAIHLVTPAATPAGQIGQIAATGWDQTHYGGAGGPNLLNEFSALFGSGALGAAAEKAPITSNPAVGLPGTGTGNINVGGIANSIPGVSQAESVVSFLGKLTDPKLWVRGGEMVAGGVLIILGVVAIIKGGSGSPAQQTTSAAKTVAAPIKAARPKPSAFAQAARAEDRAQSRNAGRREVRRRAKGLSATTEANLAGKRAQRATANL